MESLSPLVVDVLVLTVVPAAPPGGVPTVVELLIDTLDPFGFTGAFVSPPSTCAPTTLLLSII